MIQPDDISDLKLWLDADDINVTEGQNIITWSGKGGTTVNATGATGSNKSPVLKVFNKQKYVYFDNVVRQRMDLTENIFANNTSKTIFTVIHPLSNGHIIGISTSSTPYYTYLKGLTVQNGKIGVSSRSNSSGSLVETNNSDYLNKKQLIIATIENKNTSLKTSYEPFKKDTINNANYHAAYSKSTIGASDGSNSNAFIEPYRGYIGEIIIYNRVLTELEITQVEKYLKNKFFKVKNILLKSNDNLYSLESINTVHETKMTSNTAPAPLISSASSEFNTTYQAWKAFNGTVVDANDGWVTNFKTGWIQIYLGNEKIFNTLEMSFRATGSLTSAPRDFNIMGSNDGVHFDVISNFTNQTNWKSSETRHYKFSNSKKYSFYRINVTENNGHSQLSIGDILFGFRSYISEIPNNSERNFVEYGVDKIDDFNFTHNGKSYILQDAISENVEGLRTTQLNRKPLSISFN
ncbi:discoidin domain-containing protein [Metasolibacillus meyeri]|uniref:Discoidin domain-containing protein n=1 Tax=Metasolibacillus meyeri TaxID=1071052 RepID=A0AAW9NT03_9BACL|nr:discoidin domain-containing protein [Metasolibacillus meyeri]MEC1179203.1 discoidin domain-containing protein [Metasolibacillus meyeri]